MATQPRAAKKINRKESATIKMNPKNVSHGGKERPSLAADRGRLPEILPWRCLDPGLRDFLSDKTLPLFRRIRSNKLWAKGDSNPHVLSDTRP